MRIVTANLDAISVTLHELKPIEDKVIILSVEAHNCRILTMDSLKVIAEYTKSAIISDYRPKNIYPWYNYIMYKGIMFYELTKEALNA